MKVFSLKTVGLSVIQSIECIIAENSIEQMVRKVIDARKKTVYGKRIHQMSRVNWREHTHRNEWHAIQLLALKNWLCFQFCWFVCANNVYKFVVSCVIKFRPNKNIPFRVTAWIGSIWICVKPRSDGPFRNDITSSGVYVVFSTIVSSIDSIWSPTESAPHL